MTAFAGPLSVGGRINRAVWAPYEDFARRDAAAFCDDFTQAVAAKIVEHAPANSTCATTVGEMFALSAPYQPKFSASLPADWKATNIVRRGDRASALFHYGKQGSTSFVLRRIAGRWLIASRARLVLLAGCGGHLGAEGCPPGAHVVIALIGIPTVRSGTDLASVPARVRQAGGGELRDFKRGRLVFAQTGCEACHRIGTVGNRHPGPALTHIGSTLSTRGIERALIDPSEPMPSFKRLPKTKFRALVRFLSLLH